MNQTAKHQPVMLQEAVDALNVEANAWYVDATFGRGGHTQEILSRGGKVIAFDVDQQAIEYGQSKFADQITEGKLKLVRENFDRLESTLDRDQKISGILFDFGTSVDQLTDDERGFSFDSDAPLDMRMDNRLGVTAADLLNVLPEKQLADLFIEFGGEHQARSIAKAIVQNREKGQPLTTTRGLADLIIRTKGRREALHPATKVFQALRIAVNSELDAIEAALPQAWNILQPGGRIVTIAFHEGEDRPVKHILKKWVAEGKGTIITDKPLTPSPAEVATNPRARSAKLRIFEKARGL
ncbi:MAG TPA: 16S rRNA (cytosine(1402)-N(4))-methyltransferase RsmH [Patescibacteria group bacterium]